MSNLNHDTAARLLGLSPGELEVLVKGGNVRRVDRNAYALVALVQDYIAHVKAEGEKREIAPKQADIAEHLDLSERAVRELLNEIGIDHKRATLSEIRVAYIRRQREIAAGRATAGDLDLATERARLAREQADKIAMQNAVTRGELTRTEVVEQILAAAAAKIAGTLDAIPGMVRRRVPQLTAGDIELIAVEVTKARNTVASMSLADLDIDEVADFAALPPSSEESLPDGGD